MVRVSDKRPGQNLKTAVIVVGGGAAGLAAACTAARAGARVLLLAKYGFCGAAVAGLAGTVCWLSAATDNRSAAPEKVVFGFADRFLDVMRMKSGITDP